MSYFYSFVLSAIFLILFIQIFQFVTPVIKVLVVTFMLNLRFYFCNYSIAVIFFESDASYLFLMKKFKEDYVSH